MIKIPFEQIVDKIKDKSELSLEEINSKINEKTKQLSGLISKEGAAHIVANELGIKIFEEVSGKLQIKNVLAGMRDVETAGKVLQVYDVREFNSNGREGKVASLVIGDETGNIRVVLWGEQTNNIADLKKGDVVKVLSGYVRENQGRKEIHMNERAKFIINPEGVSIGDVAENVSEAPSSTRKAIKDLNEGDNNVELLGTIVQAFNPNFFEVCPKCSKRTKPDDDGVFKCPEHGEITPDYSYVFNAVLDDGTENIRTVFFRNQMERLLGSSKEEILSYRESPDSFNPVKNDLLGKMVKVSGRVTKNSFFDRIEFLANMVFPNPSPEDELKNSEK